MRRYKFNLCNVERGTVDACERLCADDLDALDVAARIWKDYIIEVRENETFVARVKPDGQPPDERDTVALLYPRDAPSTRQRQSPAQAGQDMAVEGVKPESRAVRRRKSISSVEV